MCFHSVKQKSREGLKAARTELEEREKLREDMQGVQVWLEAADGLLSEMQQSRSTQELQVGHSSEMLSLPFPICMHTINTTQICQQQ